MKKPCVLVVDDEPNLRELLTITLERINMVSKEAADLASAKKYIDEGSFDLCLTDLCLPDGSGLELISYIQAKSPGTPVAVITAHASIDTAIQALKNGAFDFLMKPVDMHLLRNLLKTAVKVKGLEQQKGAAERLIGESAVIQQLKNKIIRLAKSQAPIYISGPSGSGKELVARLIHDSGPRAEKPFVPVNCGAISRELMESEFFGHKKGSFTGAIQDKIGFFQAAQEGTLFLDEVAELPLDMQVKLLRAIQEKAIRPVGSATEILVDVRILSATHKDLKAAVAEKLFREDLFYRINVIEIVVPSLKERQSDISLLANDIIDKFSDKMQIKKPVLEKNALYTLQHYDFPGNVRELENILERAMTLCDNGVITQEELQLPITQEAQIASVQHHPPDTIASYNWETESLDSYLDKLSREAIERALQKTKGNKTLAAKLLGMSLRALRYRLKKLGLQ
jgi:two-component system response regulator PilR (NtrC family)